jgi:flagellar motility protein MotE (MotC chaperone)
MPGDSGIGGPAQLTPDVGPQTPPDDPNAKAQELARQQQDMLMLRRQMDQRLSDIKNAEQKMKDMLREAKSLEDQKVKQLILMYANMKPRVAAQAIESLEDRVAVRILSGMTPKQSGEIITYTTPEVTAKLTELLTRMKMAQDQ